MPNRTIFEDHSPSLTFCYLVRSEKDFHIAKCFSGEIKVSQPYQRSTNLVPSRWNSPLLCIQSSHYMCQLALAFYRLRTINKFSGYKTPLRQLFDKCFCSGLPRTTLKVDRWECKYEALEKAAHEAYQRCAFYVRRINAFDPNMTKAVSLVKTTQVYGDREVFMPTSKACLESEIFALPGK